MKIVVLNKRQYMRKDVIDDQYGRLFELPYKLAQRKHQLLVHCLSYQKRDQGLVKTHHRDGQQDGIVLDWYSINLGRTILPGFVRYLRSLRTQVDQFQPDILLGCSDCLNIIITGWLAKQLGIPYAIDLYDNFESFGMTRIPGMLSLYQRALRGAGAVSCVSQPLADYVTDNYRQNASPAIAIESTINHQLFHPRDREQCRQKLGLPINGQLVGTAGALDKMRGIETLFRSFERLSSENSRLHLVLAGAVDKNTPPPSGANVHTLGLITHQQVAELFCALDVAVITMPDNNFGRFAFPQKAYEIIASQTALVATEVGPLAMLLADWPHSLYRVDDVDNLEQQLRAQLQKPVLPLIDVPSWADQAETLEKMLLEVLS